MSPLDWALIETWQEREVPLHIIVRGIEKVFDGLDKQPARKRTVKSLMFCREEIEAQYAEWLESQIGKEIKVETPEPEVKSQKIQVEKPAVKADREYAAEDELFPREMIAAHLTGAAAELKAAKSKTNGELSKTLESVSNGLAKLKEHYTDTETLEADLNKLDSLIDDSLLKNNLTESLKNDIKKELVSYRNKMDADVYQRTFDLMLLKRLRDQMDIPRLSLFYL